MSELTSHLFALMRHAPASVWVMSAGGEKVRQAITVSSVISATINPNSMLVSINKKAGIHKVLAVEEYFSLSLLSQQDQAIAAKCSGGEEGEARFQDEGWEPKFGISSLVTTQGGVICQIEKLVELPTHSLVIGQVIEVVPPKVDTSVSATLVYANQVFGQFRPEE